MGQQAKKRDHPADQPPKLRKFEETYKARIRQRHLRNKLRSQSRKRGHVVSSTPTLAANVEKAANIFTT